MPQNVSRRAFLISAGAAMAAPRFLMPATKVPKLLDHLLLGCNDLAHGIDFVYDQTGVRAVFGGVHPGNGTQNALLSLGDNRYLEIIAPDPKQVGVEDSRGLKKLIEPRLVAWAAHPSDIEAFAARLEQSGLAVEGPKPGSRKRPDGRVLTWKTLAIRDAASNLLPFFIEWSADSLHPSVDAPKGCRLESFVLETLDPEQLANTLALLELDVTTQRSAKAQLAATIIGPEGELRVTS
jgi:hypothetical protein